MDTPNIAVIEKPSQQLFKEKYFTAHKPVIIKDAVANMKAVQEWSPAFFRSKSFMKTIPDKTVTVLLKSDDNGTTFSQQGQFGWKEMSFREFIQIMSSDTPESGKYYLAQRFLKDFPELSPWFHKPDFVPDRTYPMTFWIGKESVTPLHFDANDNVFFQIMGTKKIILISPEDYPNVYLNPNRKLGHMSLVRDAENPDLQQFPDFAKVTTMECTLGPGDAIFIPKGWLHYLRTEEISVSINFWCPTWYAYLFSKIKQFVLSLLRGRK